MRLFDYDEYIIDLNKVSGISKLKYNKEENVHYFEYIIDGNIISIKNYIHWELNDFREKFYSKWIGISKINDEDIPNLVNKHND